MIVVMDLIVSNAGKGGPGFIEITWLKSSSRFCITGEASGESIGCQFTLFSHRVLIAFEHVGMSEFMGDDR